MNKLKNGHPIDFSFLYRQKTAKKRHISVEDEEDEDTEVFESEVATEQPSSIYPMHVVWATCRYLDELEINFTVWCIYEQRDKQKIKLRGDSYHMVKEAFLAEYKTSELLKHEVRVGIEDEIVKRQQ